MEFPEKISEKLTAVISNNLEDLPEQKLAEINYGIAVFVANSYKMLILFILAMLMNVFTHFLIAFVSFGVLRTFACGVHAKREWTCLISSIVIFFGIAYLGMTINLNIYAVSTIFTLCFIIVLQYAPADTEERPIASLKLRRKLRIMSCAAVVFQYAAAMYYSGTSVSSIITFSALVESLLLLPITYRLTGNMYGVGIRIRNKREV